MKTLKTWKKRAALLLAAVMTLVFCMGMTTFAANIVIQAPADIKSLEGMTVNAYQVLTGTNAAEPTYTVHNDFNSFFSSAKNTYTGLKLTPDASVYLTYDSTEHQLVLSENPVSGAIEIEDASTLDDTYFEADLISRLSGGSGTLKTFSTWLTDYVNNSVMIQTPISETAGKDEKTINLESLSEGYYILVAQDVPDGVSIQQSILQVTDGNSTYTIELKAEDIPFEKTVDADTEDSVPAGKEDTASVGDILDYTITTRVPDPVDFAVITAYKISDTLTNQKLDSDSLVLTFTAASGSTTVYKSNPGQGENDIADILVSNGEEYTGYGQNGNVWSSGFVLTFDPTEIAAFAGQDITLTYEAELMSEAINVNGNTATLEYTNDGEPSSQTDSTKIYTYGMDIQKIFSDDSKVYNDVVFQLRTSAADEKTAITFVGTAGDYKVKDSDDAQQGTTDLKLDTGNGTLELTGLDEGTYYLVETNTEDGFNTADVITVVLTADGENKEVLDGGLSSATMGTQKLSVIVGTETGSNISLAGFEVLNQKGFDLPETGGAGTWMFTIGGIVLIAAAGGLFLALRRKSR